MCSSDLYATVKLLAKDLYDALAPSQRDLIDGDMLILQKEIIPYVRPGEFPAAARPKPVVVVSEGFVDLMNNLSYATANNLFEKGCLEKYVRALALEGGDKADTTERRDVVPERRMEDAPFAIAEHHQHRLLAAGALIAGIRERCRKNRHVLAGAAKSRVQLVSDMHPHFG